LADELVLDSQGAHGFHESFRVAGFLLRLGELLLQRLDVRFAQASFGVGYGFSDRIPYFFRATIIAIAIIAIQIAIPITLVSIVSLVSAVLLRYVIGH